jgi:hypothetical protein
MSDFFEDRAARARAEIRNTIGDGPPASTSDDVRRIAGQRRRMRLAAIPVVMVLAAAPLALARDGSSDQATVVADQLPEGIETPTPSEIPAETTTTTPTSPSTVVAVPSTSPVPARCHPRHLRSTVSTDRAAYVPGDEVTVTTSIQNIGTAPCRLPNPKGEEGCRPWVVVHFSFDLEGDGDYGPTTWTYGSYRSCQGSGDLVLPGASATRTTKFRFGEGSTGPLPDGEWQVIADWDVLAELNTPFPQATFRCVPGTCKPLEDYSPSTTSTSAPTTTSTSASTTTST